MIWRREYSQTKSIKFMQIKQLIGNIAFGGVLAGFLFFSACKKNEGADGPNKEKNSASQSIQNIGSDTMVNLAQAWAEEYATIVPSISVEVNGGGSGIGIAALI